MFKELKINWIKNKIIIKNNTSFKGIFLSVSLNKDISIKKKIHWKKLDKADLLINYKIWQYNITN